MNVKLVPVTAYEVVCESGESLGQFTKESAWNGLVKLRKGDQYLIVVDDSFCIGLLGEATREAQVVMATDALRAVILSPPTVVDGEKKPNEQGASDGK